MFVRSYSTLVQKMELYILTWTWWTHFVDFHKKRKQVLLKYIAIEMHMLFFVYAVKVMTSFGYEIMCTRGCWFQTLDVNKPWRQIPADHLLFLVFTPFFFFSDYPRQYEGEKFCSNQTTLLKEIFEAASGRITKLVQASYKKRTYNVWVISQNMFCLTHVIMQTHPDNTRYHCHVHPAVYM